ncbi:unnamed protein product [Rotaria magnacalcarata]|uniref:Uncharacterized protein n=1 Tax=Rotaria magnacalcarata TaxID=392030 RepID=A0A815KQ92_9BILA|nr:unnamed protein product [Rotaria magnacalcarata]CAF4913549.1 unnamed protein product [Rotaria magnacalcarata]CAF5095276.1 unnamed protein product [Rotaria magnacalcarata]
MITFFHRKSSLAADNFPDVANEARVRFVRNGVTRISSSSFSNYTNDQLITDSVTEKESSSSNSYRTADEVINRLRDKIKSEVDSVRFCVDNADSEAGKA